MLEMNLLSHRSQVLLFIHDEGTSYKHNNETGLPAFQEQSLRLIKGRDDVTNHV